jgi:hypothetical protein
MSAVRGILIALCASFAFWTPVLGAAYIGLQR